MEAPEWKKNAVNELREILNSGNLTPFSFGATDC
jgi:hypothetical protein